MTTCELYYVHFLLFLLYVCKYSLYTANLPLPGHFTTVRPPTAPCSAGEVGLFQADPRWSLPLGAGGDLCSDLLFGFISWVTSLLVYVCFEATGLEQLMELTSISQQSALP